MCQTDHGSDHEVEQLVREGVEGAAETRHHVSARLRHDAGGAVLLPGDPKADSLFTLCFCLVW